jgi:hypothetical protein
MSKKKQNIHFFHQKTKRHVPTVRFFFVGIGSQKNVVKVGDVKSSVRMDTLCEL